MPSIIRIDLSARLELDYGSEISRLGSVKFVPLDFTITVDSVEELENAIGDALVKWLEQAKEIEEANRTMLQFLGAKPNRVFKLPSRRKP